MKNFSEDIRAVQLDLARQMETVSFIKSFIDMIAVCHYNVLFLYLEWRVRTRSVDLGEECGYTAAELRDIIGYASGRGITVVPGIACLGHSELILQREEFSGLAELREGIPGRFGGHFAMDLCPSLDGTRELLEAYIADVAEIFRESPWIHVGGDEVHDLGLCSLCRNKARDYAGEQRIYLDHLKQLHRIVSGLGRRMMLWDDMFELYGDILEELPRDIILVCWQYQDCVKEYLGHFNNLRFEERFLQYDRLGFDYLIGAVDHPWSNFETSAAYGRKYHPAGFLLTSWEKQTALLYHFLPDMAAAGCLWHNPAQDPEQVWNEAVSRIFGLEDELLVRSLRQYAALPGYLPRGAAGMLTCFDFFGPDFRSLEACRMLTAVLEKFTGCCGTDLGKTVLQDVLADLRLKTLAWRSSCACWSLFHGMQGEDPELLGQEIQKEREKYSGMISVYRREGDCRAFEKMMTNWQSELKNVTTSLKNRGCLKILFVLPDGYGAQNFRFVLDGVELQTSCFKAEGAVFFEKMLFFDPQLPVRELLIESWGYGGQGIAYVSAVRENQQFVPDRILESGGVVEHGGDLLTPDCRYAFFGSTDIRKAYACRQTAEKIHWLRLGLKENL